MIGVLSAEGKNGSCRYPERVSGLIQEIFLDFLEKIKPE